MKKILITCIIVALSLSSPAQSPVIWNSSGHIVSQSGTYWVVDNGNFTLKSESAAFPAQIDKLTINAGASLTIPPLNYLTVTGALTNSEGATGLVIGSDASGTGSLIHSTVNVDGTVQRFMNNADWSDWQDGWHFLSSPVASQAISPAFITDPATGYDFYCWYEPLNTWVNYKNTTDAPTWNTANGSSNFTTGKGYMAAYDAEGIKTFSGKLTVADLSVTGLTITNGGANKSWHLLGNPFSSPLTWDASSDWNLVNIAGVAKIWNEGNQSYTDLTSSPSTVIPATNGFMVQVSSGTGSLTLPAAKRIHSSQGFYKSATPYMQLVARNTNAGNAQESNIFFNSEATTGFDLMYDGEFLAGYGPQFYSVAGNEHFSTNSLPEAGGTVQIPFDFIKNEGTSFTIEVATISGIQGPVILNDLKTGQTQDLTVNPSYSFTSTAGDNPSRFLLSFSHVGTDEIKTYHPFTIYATGNTISVVNLSGKNQGSVFVYNMMGQLIGQQELNGNQMTKISLNAGTGYYLVKMITGEGAYSTKIFMN